MGALTAVGAPRACCVDAKGGDVFVGDLVLDSFADVRRVAAIEPIPGSGCAWLVCEDGSELVPHLVERVGGKGDPCGM